MGRENTKFLSSIRVALSILVVFSTTFLVGDKLRLPYSGARETARAFYSFDENSLDYVVIGSSAALQGIAPIEIYKNTGLKGYNLSMASLRSDVYVSMLNEVVSKQRGVSIIVDVDAFFYDDSRYEDYLPASIWIDSMNVGRNWLDTIIELDKDHFFEHLFPISKYHNKLTDVQTQQLAFGNEVVDFYKGSCGFDNDPDDVYRFDLENADIYSFDLDEISKLPNKSDNYFHSFLDTCKKYNLENVIFVRLPKSGLTESDYNKQYERTKQCNYIEKEIEPYGYKLIDYVALGNPAGIVGADFVDMAHMHVNGALKYSNFLGSNLEKIIGSRQNKDEKWNCLLENVDEIYNKIRY